MTKISTITKAKVPICKFFDPQLKLKCDVNVNMSIALRNTDLITRYVELDPRVRPLLMVVKYWARRRQLNDGASFVFFWPFVLPLLSSPVALLA